MTTSNCKCSYCGADLVRKSAPSIKSVNHFCDKRCKGEWQRSFKPVTKKWLIEHYVEKRLDTTQIAHIVKRDPKSVWNWLKDFGIPTRPRGGHTSPGAFKKGQENLFKGMKHTDETRAKLRAIAKADGRVPYDPKVGSYMKGRYGENTPSWKGGITPERQSVYSSQEWVDAVKTVWARDRATCQSCGKHHNTVETRGTFHIHHIVSFKDASLRTDPKNLVLLCDECHRFVHSKRNIDKQFIKDMT